MADEQPSQPESRFTRADLIMLLVLVTAAFCLRAWRLDFPPREYFDEIYYVEAAQKLWANQPDPNNVHPPLGKLMLGLFIQVNEGLQAMGLPLSASVGWRLGSLVLGTAIIPLTFYLGWVMPRGGRRVAFGAAALVSLDFMHLVQSRIAMLDMYQAFWVMVGLVAAWHFISSSRYGWAAVAALCFGAATAVKWNGLFAAFGCFWAMVLCTRPFSWRRLALVFALFAVLIPAVYVGSYFQIFVREKQMGYPQYEQIRGYHERMWKFRYNKKEFDHRYISMFYEWPVVMRPVWYYYQEFPEPGPDKKEVPEKDTTVQGIVAMGCPLFWLPFLFFLAEGAILAVASRDPARGLLVAAYLAQWLLWASATTGGFIYYMLPMIPIMALLTSLSISEWTDSPGWTLAYRCFFLGLLLAFILYFPLLTALDVSERYFRTLFFVDRWI